MPDLEFGTFLVLYEEDGGEITVKVEHEQEIDAAVTQFLHENRDQLLHLTTLAGEDYVVRASRVAGWIKTSPTGRANTYQLEQMQREELRNIRIAGGGGWDEEHEEPRD